jgi:hypothetical protein
VDIRKDFVSVSEYLERLVQYANVFAKNNVEAWPHYKNREDFEKVYSLDVSVRKHFEDIYAIGRDCAVAMSSRLVAFNYPEECPTLADFVHSLDGGWLDEIDDLRRILTDARKVANTIENCPWSVARMIELFEDQIKLLLAARSTIDLLRQTRLFKIEAGVEKVDQAGSLAEQPWWKSFDRRIAVIGLIVAILALAISASIL